LGTELRLPQGRAGHHSANSSKTDQGKAAGDDRPADQRVKEKAGRHVERDPGRIQNGERRSTREALSNLIEVADAVGVMGLPREQVPRCNHTAENVWGECVVEAVSDTDQ
jgi:hypothetical protein